MKSAKVFTRIESPYEILDRTTSRGKFIYKRYEKIKNEYDVLLEKAAERKTTDSILLFTYKQDRMSFTGEMSNEFLYKNPNKIILICREKSGEMKCSLRTAADIKLNKVVECG